MRTEKDLPFDKRYAVTSDGQVISYVRARKVMVPSPNRQGYMLVNIAGKTHLVHRLIAEMFVPNPFDKEHVTHKNGVPSDNRAENLEWVTRQETTMSGMNPEAIKKGVDHHAARFEPEDIVAIRARHARGETLASIAKWYDVTYQCISRIVKRQTWKHVE